MSALEPGTLLFLVGAGALAAALVGGIVLALVLRRRDARPTARGGHAVLTAVTALAVLGLSLPVLLLGAMCYGELCDNHDADLLETGRHVGAWEYAGSADRIDRYWPGLRRFEIRPDREGATRGPAMFLVDEVPYPCSMTRVPLGHQLQFEGPGIAFEGHPQGLREHVRPWTSLGVQHCVWPRRSNERLTLFFQTTEGSGSAGPFTRR